MFDLFGLKKEAEGAEDPSSNGEPRGETGPAKLWAAALVVDSLFVIVFGGAVAAKVYQHWKAPAAQRPAPAAAKKPVEAPKPPPEPAPAEPVPAPAQAPEPPKAAAEPPKEAEPATQGRAVAVDFQLKAPGAKSVELGGAFIVRNNGRKPMVRHSDGTWTLTLYLTPDTYRYFFLVNGKKTLDPKNSKTDRGASVLIVAPR